MDNEVLERIAQSEKAAQEAHADLRDRIPGNGIKIANLEGAIRNGLTARLNRIDKRVWWILTVAILGLATTAAEVAAVWSGG